MKKWIVCMVAMYCVVGCLVGCASSKSASADSDNAMEEQVMYAPPAENEPVEIPPGGPVLEEYAKPSSKAPDGNDVSREEAEGSLFVQRDALDALLAKGPGWGLVHVKVTPVKDDRGNLVAYQVSELTDEASAWLSPALQVGDQITHLNGVRIQTPDDYMKAWNLSKSVTELRIDYVRAGTPSALSWVVVDE